jgi:hypothetical protein
MIEHSVDFIERGGTFTIRRLQRPSLTSSNHSQSRSRCQVQCGAVRGSRDCEACLTNSASGSSAFSLCRNAKFKLSAVIGEAPMLSTSHPIIHAKAGH